MPFHHIPVMTQEVLQYLEPGRGGVFADCTLGGTGHAQAILETLPKGGTFIGIDWDREAISHAEQTLKSHGRRIHLFHGNFTHFSDYLLKLKHPAVDGILLDLGVSLQQIEYGGRGFSFKKDEPLDMRMDSRTAICAEDLVNTLSEEALATLFRTYGEERHARRVARFVVQERKRRRIRTSLELAEIVSRAAASRDRASRRIHPATRVFMALRIAVNHELDHLGVFLDQAAKHLNPGGRICVIAFHSLEDRIVKTRFRGWERQCTCPPDFPQCVCGGKPNFRRLTTKPVRPSEKERERNPMARSARLRAAVRIVTDGSAENR